jgi:hypothetical protein
MLGLNGSVILIIAMILNYFFSADLPIIARGITFIAIGVGFVGLNLVVTKKFKKLQKEA